MNELQKRIMRYLSAVNNNKNRLIDISIKLEKSYSYIYIQLKILEAKELVMKRENKYFLTDMGKEKIQQDEQ
jgi:predicted transcriptional regulator